MTTEPTPEVSPNRSAMFIAFLVTAIDLLGFGIVLPLVPRIADDYLEGFSPAATGLIIGLLYSSFSLMQFIFAPIWGRISDRIGRRPILLLSLFGSVIFYALFGFASSFPREQATLALILLLVSRVGAGIAGASVSTAAAVIADCTTPEKRAKGMALIGVAFGVGFTFGPLIAWAGDSIFEGAHYGPGVAASVLSFVGFIIAVVKFKETLVPGPKPKRQFFSVQRSLEVLRVPTVGALILVSFLAIMAFANFEATLSLFTESAFGLDRRDNYLVFAYVGLVLMIAQGGVYRPLSNRRSDDYLLKLGIGMMLIGLGGLMAVAYGTYRLQGNEAAISSVKTLFYLSITIGVFGFAFLNPSVTALISRRSDSKRQGEVLGVAQSFSALARILGPLAGTSLYEWNESRVLPFAFAVLLMFFVVALLANTRTSEPGLQTVDEG